MRCNWCEMEIDWMKSKKAFQCGTITGNPNKGKIASYCSKRCYNLFLKKIKQDELTNKIEKQIMKLGKGRGVLC
jgi:endogenous inhibitor of DNA gyrase (YacG/DUF329 family)